MLEMGADTVSGYAKWEGPDPAYWCAHGYAVCNPDARGIAKSDGDSVMFGRQEGQDCHDLVEWLAAQDWCTGKVGMTGTSYLSISQWFTAAERPPHLTAINPWEGLSDAYRDLVMRGGVPDLGFAKLLEHNYTGANRREDIVAEAQRHLLMNEIWEDKIARFDQINVPAYIVASYSNTLHTNGTFRGWRRIASKENGCASIIPWNGQITIPMLPNCGASSITISKGSKTDGNRPLVSAMLCSTSLGMTALNFRPTRFHPRAS